MTLRNLRNSCGLSAEQRSLLTYLLEEEGIELHQTETIPRRKNPCELPLSFAQQRLWFLNQLEPGNPSYNQPKAVRLTGILDEGALQKALDHVVNRHEALRTTFVVVNGAPVQVIVKSRSIDLRIADLRSLSDDVRDAEANRLLVEDARHPFDLSEDLMLRAQLLRVADREHILLLVTHHIASDDWSIGILWRELGKLYATFSLGEPDPLPELPIQYKDYAIWQRESLQGEVLESQLSYWRKQLNGVRTLQLPIDRTRPALQSFRGARQSLVLPLDLGKAVNKLSHREGVTLFMTLLAAFQALLHRHTGQDDIVVGSPIAGRTCPEIEGLIGFFVNTLVLRTDLSGNPTFRELLSRVREVCLGAYAHQEMPFDKLVEELKPERDLSRTPLFQVVFNFHNTLPKALELPGLSVQPLRVDSGTAVFDLALIMEDTEEGLIGRIRYRTDLFLSSTITRMLTHLEVLLAAVATQPNVRLSELRKTLDKADKQHQISREKHLEEASIQKLKTLKRKSIGLQPKSEDRL
jgi:hypothetical protein